MSNGDADCQMITVGLLRGVNAVDRCGAMRREETISNIDKVRRAITSFTSNNTLYQPTLSDL